MTKRADKMKWGWVGRGRIHNNPAGALINVSGDEDVYASRLSWRLAPLMYAVPDAFGRALSTTVIGVTPPASAVKENVAVGEAARRSRVGRQGVDDQGVGVEADLEASA